jgi:signal transduction histidine kinase
MYEKLYQNAPVMFLSLDADSYNIIDVNDKVTSVMKMSKEELKNKSFLDFFEDECRCRVETSLRVLNNGDDMVLAESDAFKLNGDDDLYVSMCASAIRDTPTGSIVLHVILNNVSVVLQSKRSVEELNAKLVEAKERAEQSNTAKSQFLAMMSHELRTPLHGLICSCDLLLDSLLSSDQKNHVDVMQTSSNLLLKVCNSSTMIFTFLS